MDEFYKTVEDLIDHKKSMLPPKRQGRSTLDRVVEWMSDGTGTLTLSEDDQKIFRRWKELYKLKYDGKTISQINKYMETVYGITDRTVREDMRAVGKIFRPEFNADMEMYILYERNSLLIQRLENSNNPKNLAIVAKLKKEQREIILYFKGDSNLPDPNLMKPHTYVITVNPADLGINETIPSVEELLRKYKSKRVIQDAEIMEDGE